MAIRSICGLGLILVILALSAGCGSNRDDDGSMDPSSELARGWQEYASDNYGAAILAFEKVINGEAPADIVGDAYNGLGWSYINISQNVDVNQANLNNAIGKFRKSIESDRANSDAMIGYAVALMARRNTADDYKKAIEMVESARNGDATYMYRHDYGSEADLRALKAQCYYYLGDFDRARSEADMALTDDGNSRTALAIKLLVH